MSNGRASTGRRCRGRRKSLFCTLSDFSCLSESSFLCLFEKLAVDSIDTERNYPQLEEIRNQKRKEQEHREKNFIQKRKPNTTVKTQKPRHSKLCALSRLYLLIRPHRLLLHPGGLNANRPSGMLPRRRHVGKWQTSKKAKPDRAKPDQILMN